MTFVVPYDGGELARTALDRAVALGELMDVNVVVVTVVPHDSRYARKHGWLAADEAFDVETVVTQIRADVRDLAPEARFEYVLTDQYASPGTIASKVRNKAREVGASVVFVGSDDAGRLVTSLRSVGSTIAADDRYDVYIVRKAEPSAIDQVAERSRLFD
ncbi:universal stress protein [Haloarchaeobius amylolyticus]|uniref:universal stress protein n=1 Tax=Haloarchaeobius amylolyticus TaxID=1198296 RepID=UPI00227006EE|nr:universal stress protein [Haloarchaeobius amylolyticus]